MKEKRLKRTGDEVSALIFDDGDHVIAISEM